VEEFKILCMVLKYQNSIQEINKSRLKSGIVCYHSVWNLWSSIFYVQKYKDDIILNYKLAFCLYGCETWSLTLREERVLRSFVNSVVRRIFGPKGVEVTRL
jgi:hypothetical protein